MLVPRELRAIHSWTTNCMARIGSIGIKRIGIWAGTPVLLGAAITVLWAQSGAATRNAQALFTSLDPDGDGTLTRSELASGFNSWFKAWDTANGGKLTREQIAAGLSNILPAPPAARPGQMNTFNSVGNSTPLAAPQADVDAMTAALPTTPGAKPQRPRKVLVLAHTGAGGFVHASIPLAAKTVEALGQRGGLWTTTIAYDATGITADNLKQYDAIFLDSTTACFLDDKDPSVTAARRQAFMDFVRSGKGVAGIHAATDSYHTNCLAAQAAASGGTAPNIAATVLSNQLIEAGDKDNDGSVTQQEWTA